MARLVMKSGGGGDRVIELVLKVNRFGRSPENHFQIEDPTVSAHHCEITLTGEGAVIRDCDSTNGTFINGHRVKEARLSPGQTLHLGGVELLVESADVTIAIPKIDLSRPMPPVVLADGSMLCPRHPNARATYQCSNCREVLCEACVHSLRRQGGKPRKLCPLCSHECVKIGGETKKTRKSFLGRWRQTVKLPFLSRSRSKKS
jgi:pSer/pThr/pTyr-binding forkhead associated (FHA) protein